MLALLLPLPALGHAGGSLTAIDAARGADGSALVEASFGLLLGAPEGAWSWVCHEAVTSPDATLSPRYRRGGDALVAVVTDPAQAREADARVYRSTDGGCSWPAIDGLRGRAVAAVAPSPVDPLAWVAVTGDDGAVLVSLDGGEAWTELLAGSAGRALGSVAIGATGAVWAAGRQADGQLVLVHAASLTEAPTVHLHPPPDPGGGAGAVDLAVLATAPGDGAQAWLAVGPTTGDRLWWTGDGGATVEELLAVEADLVDGGVAADGATWVLEASRQPWRAPDGRAFTALPGLPPGIGLDTAGEAVWTTSAAEYTGMWAVAVQPDGSWEAALRPPDLEGPLDCRDGSEQRELCVPLWATVEANLAVFQPADTGDTGPGDGGGGEDGGDGGGAPVDDEAPACGCAAAPGGGLVGLLPWAWLRRRRARGPAAGAPRME